MKNKCSISVTGPISLLEAFSKELDKLDYKMTDHSHLLEDAKCLVTYANGAYQYLNYISDGVGDCTIKRVNGLKLPLEWDRALELAKEFEEEKFEKGDWVVVLESDEFYGNSEKCAQEIDSIKVDASLPYSLMFSDGRVNAYAKVRKATKEEIEEAKKKTEVRIGNYTAEYAKKGIVKFGCNEYSLGEVNAFLKLVNVSDADIFIRDVKITREMLIKITKNIKI